MDDWYLTHHLGCSGRIIAGDFNATSLEDHRFVDTKNLVNAWIAFQTLMTSIME